MRSFIRSALLGAAGLVALSLSAHAVGSTAVTDTPLFKSTTTTMPMQLAFGGMYKQSQSTKPKKKKTKKEEVDSSGSARPLHRHELKSGATCPGLFHVSRQRAAQCVLE